MVGHFIDGSGQASKCCRPHREVFNCDMLGTFNVLVPHFNILEHQPSVTNFNNDKQYWFLVIDNKHFGWAIRDKTSRQRVNTLEVLTKELLPDSLKNRDINVELLPKWSEHKVTQWAADKYWFQTFPFSPKKRADSALVWSTIDIIDWEKLKVLDWGCHYGYMSFEASKRGAIVLGVDNNVESLRMAKIIRNHIVQQDVQFRTNFSHEKKSYDVIMYLSVHHQIDPTYSTLSNIVEELKALSRKHVFIELILPPTFPKSRMMTENDINKIVGGRILRTYKHAVRGMRNIYYVKA